MAIETPICNFGEKAKDFSLLSTENKKISLSDIKGENGTLIMFICNHCPYVQSVIKAIVDDAKFFQSLGVKTAAIMSNDVKAYPEDSFENIILHFHIYMMKNKMLLKAMEQFVHLIFLDTMKISNYNTEEEFMQLVLQNLVQQ